MRGATITLLCAGHSGGSCPRCASLVAGTASAVVAVFIGARLPVKLIERIDDYARSEGITRSEAMRRLIEAGLKRQRPKTG